ncbi:isochorismatase family cysteine hydrolase [Tessaracoccus coleopterorum]|uniref:isochorismatase family cysteine hydrolase n=1 Tax=Tessaracoccus coleopterorum TaxID=2714950 RepID=UPI0018D3EDFF|nr:isochorismatase family cysteine hydrolase [Tessaracoccus coleopterorum]
MKAESTALVLIEFQNDFTTPGGTLHDAVKETMDATGTLDNAVAAADAVREAGGAILHVPISFAPGYGEITSHPYGILAGVVASTSFVRGGWGAEICEQLTPQEGDITIEGKRGLDAFGSTNLDFVLRSKGIDTVVLAGFLTNCCVESTMRSAYEKGFEVITLTDAVGPPRRKSTPTRSSTTTRCSPSRCRPTSSSTRSAVSRRWPTRRADTDRPTPDVPTETRWGRPAYRAVSCPPRMRRQRWEEHA